MTDTPERSGRAVDRYSFPASVARNQTPDDVEHTSTDELEEAAA
jgi:hypothetical protein